MKKRKHAEEAKMKENLKKIECFLTESFFIRLSSFHHTNLALQCIE